MDESNLTLNQQEREFLASLLQMTLKDRRIEEHRTRKPSYREHVLREEEMILELLRKLGQPAT